MRILASDIADLTGGVLVGPDVEIDGACFDTRAIERGQLFVALVAQRDGHDFVAAAQRQGAAAVLISDRRAITATGSAVIVDDTAAALMRLAAQVRRRLDVPVVGVTGSVGKTSTKDLTAAALGATRRVTANERSFNNEQGLPVTILGAPENTEALIVEMGMRGFGEITRLTDVAQPTIGVVTAVAASHTGPVGGIEGVAAAKRELVAALPASGTAVLNADDERVAAMASATAASVITYGLSPDADVRIIDLKLNQLARPRFTVASPWGTVEVALATSGAHMASNAAAALAVTGVIEATIDAGAAALTTATISAQRMEITRTATGAIIVNDAYNANPDSTRAALNALANIQATRRIAVLGEMAELDDPPAGHRRVYADAVALDIDIVAVGTDLYGPTPVAQTSDIDGVIDGVIDALDERYGTLGPGDAVLVKASNSAQLWRVAAALTER